MSERVSLFMATNEYDLPDDFDDFDDNAMAQVRKAHKAATKRVKELEQELQGFRVESRKRSVQEVLTSRGYNPKLADLIPDDVTTAEDVSAWLDDRADLFQPVTPDGSEVQASDAEASQQQVETPPWAQQFNDVVNTGQAPTGDESQLLAMIQSAKTPDDLNRILFGASEGPPVY
jgi:hypothetical protein